MTDSGTRWTARCDPDTGCVLRERRAATPGRVLGASRRVLRGPAGRSRRHHRPQRRRQVHAPQDPQPHHRADHRPGSSSAAASASLLEVGTGFHPELTGRENIYLNGAILGMTQRRDQRASSTRSSPSPKSSSSSTRRSSATPAACTSAWPSPSRPTWSRRSSIVDEVLAVGDAEFQKKCLGKMDDVGHSGRTVLFVSHNMEAVTRLCQRCVLLDEGRVSSTTGPPIAWQVHISVRGPVRRLYASGPISPRHQETTSFASAQCGCGQSRESQVDVADIRRPVGIELEYEVLEPGYVFHPHFGLRNEDGILLFVAQDVDPTWRRRRRPTGRYRSTGWIPGNLLPEGVMSVGLTVMTSEPETIHASVRDTVVFRVVDSLSASDTARGDYPRPIPGVMRPLLKWTTSHIPSETPVAAQNY